MEQSTGVRAAAARVVQAARNALAPDLLAKSGVTERLRIPRTTPTIRLTFA